ncbi:hypothetical protein HUX87_01165 [Lactobacillus delbrueckii subsp. bulgaricus]|uniref:hypothetical protein n=1 Tax=Lactobacillus delbrueckii TaxID=1584 RepID=UPI0015935A2C|nr:hypothetical protein [Lactobacillus delbrueckii]NVH28984.1 hypothetical protein [Lactobacillus delbrueckii subsp. bulgaricus]NWO30582.1 hypothetical protein [Lactobacillus delbrueckii subsp. bulgaricus]
MPFAAFFILFSALAYCSLLLILVKKGWFLTKKLKKIKYPEKESGFLLFLIRKL